MIDQLDIYNSFFSFLLDNFEIQSNSQPLFSQTEKKKNWLTLQDLHGLPTKGLDMNLLAEQLLAHAYKSAQLHTNITCVFLAILTACLK